MREMLIVVFLVSSMAILIGVAVAAILYFSDKSRQPLTWTGVFLARGKLVRLAQSQPTIELLGQIESLSRDLWSRRARAMFAPIWRTELEQAEQAGAAFRRGDLEEMRTHLASMSVDMKSLRSKRFALIEAGRR